MGEQTIRRQSRNFACGSCLAFAAMGLVFVFLPFFILFDVSREEVARLPSPDRSLDAVLVEINAGAGADFAYAVRLEERGRFGRAHDAASFYAARRNQCAYGVTLRWVGPGRLLIEYQVAEQAAARPVQAGGRTVTVQLKPGIADPSAPCGGMEYNLRGRRRG